MSDEKTNASKKTRFTLISRCVIELALAAVSAVGIVLSSAGSDFMGGATTFLFFTVQSNITISLVCLVFFVNNLSVLIGGRGFVGKGHRRLFPVHHHARFHRGTVLPVPSFDAPLPKKIKKNAEISIFFLIERRLHGIMEKTNIFNISQETTQ